MKLTLSHQGPALFLAAVTLVATALAKAAPHGSWTAAAAPLLFALALAGTDLAARRGAGRGLLPSANALLLAASFVAACWLVAGSDPDRLAAMIPLLGSCATVPLIQGLAGARTSCRRAWR